MSLEQTLVIIKPDFPLDLQGEIHITREKFQAIFQRILHFQGLSIIQQYEQHLNEDIVKQHYKEKKKHPLFPDAVKYVSSGVSTIMLIEGEDAIATTRKTALAMRKKYLKAGDTKLYNMIHASDSLEEASREVQLHFNSKAA